MSGFQALLFSSFSVLLFGPAVGQNEFTVSVEQDVYEAEENSNITMTWFFPVDTDRSPDLHVDLRTMKLIGSIYYYSTRFQTEPDIDEIYRGRLQCDTQLTTKGRLQCLLTDLRLSDTDTYQCIVVLNGNTSYKPCVLNVTAASEEPAGKTPKPASRKRICMYLTLGLFTLTLFALTSLALYSIFNKR